MLDGKTAVGGGSADNTDDWCPYGGPQRFLIRFQTGFRGQHNLQEQGVHRHRE